MDAALSPQPDSTVMAAGCEEAANITSMAAQIRNCQNLPTVQGDNEIVTLLRGIAERLDRIDNNIGQLNARVDSLEDCMDRLEDRMDRLGDRMDRLEDRVERLEDEDRVERLEDRVESGFRRVEVQLLNQQVRLENSHIIASSLDEDLTPLYSLTADAQLQVIPHFPSRIDDISQMDGGRVNELLRHLEQGTTGTLAQRRTRLKRAVGGFIRYTTSAA
ncbi:hypothetical protein BU26DRAFT_511430 [Trematosphaeria pertusa]|uniref:t-SNARE coiled-coil homology domain-containing protein n=1 Tax=Trematosphaeria pertusa TaxID=390896 RepID=A0A6A6HT76_9PLEO|nr:uncharacterized protein BU26DRAFT_511430 [Trematosphaeria pertusa]KAF2241316.1 hypothetical protein BU26DRAFT_511430 [Trematosphaeria pertusa]